MICGECVKCILTVKRSLCLGKKKSVLMTLVIILFKKIFFSDFVKDLETSITMMLPDLAEIVHAVFNLLLICKDWMWF